MVKFMPGLTWLLALALASRLAAMALLPLMDTSEPRYAEIARIMAETGDWITPYFDYGIPFWGKPPLSFWSQALSFKLFGVSEFAARLPSLLATLGIAWLTFGSARKLAGREAAWLAVIIYATSALGFTAAGAVLTDPFLTLATTLTLTAAVRIGLSAEPSRLWGYLLFAGVGVGLLAKGPLMVVLVLIPLACWLYLAPARYWRRLPWAGGTLLALAISLPWYVAAEIKTPGFLNYFIVGEHLLRFLDSGWKGDLYGSAHQAAFGTIWWYALQATFPWGLIAAALLSSRLRRQGLPALRLAQMAPWQGLLVAGCLWPLCFFTAAGNILWTYVQPALPAFAILLALGLHAAGKQRSPWTIGAAALAPCVLAISAVAVFVQPHTAKSEKQLVEFARQHGGPGTTLTYLEQLPFSARFYSGGTADMVGMWELDRIVGQGGKFVAIRKERVSAVAPPVAALLQKVFENQRFALFRIREASETEKDVQAPEQRLVH